MSERKINQLIKKLAHFDGSRLIKRTVLGCGAISIVAVADYTVFTLPAKKEIAGSAARVAPPPPPEDLSKALSTKNKFLKEMRDPFYSYQISLLRAQLSSDTHTRAEAVINQSHAYQQELDRQFSASGYKARELLEISLASVSGLISILGTAYLATGLLRRRPAPTHEAENSNPSGG